MPCYAGGIDLDLPVEALLRQTDDNLGKGFRAIKMKVGRPYLASDVARVRAMRKHVGDGFPLMADANMKWTVEEAIRAARALLPFDLTWLEEPIIPDDVAGHARILAAGGVPIATCARSGNSRTTSPRGRCPIPSPTSPIAAASHPL